MRTIVDIPESDLKALKREQQKRHVSRAELVREAISQYLATNAQSADRSKRVAFGLWRSRGEDGLSYQERLRSDWDT